MFGEKLRRGENKLVGVWGVSPSKFWISNRQNYCRNRLTAINSQHVEAWRFGGKHAPPHWIEPCSYITNALLYFVVIYTCRYSLSLSDEYVLNRVTDYIPIILQWCQTYLYKHVFNNNDVIVTSVCDIEENVWSPR